jgi:hypothetical protein
MFRHSLLFCLVAACASADDGPKGDGGMTPTGPHISIAPEMPGTRDDLVATVQNGSSAFRIRWYQDGTRRDEFETGTVPHPATERDDVWRVELVDDDGTIVSMDEVTIVNSAPTAFTAQVNPGTPYGGQALRCGLNAIVVDEDNDPITYATEWTKNGAPFTDATTTDYPSDTVPGSFVARNDVFRCRMTATDGLATTSGESADVTVTCNTGGSQRFDVNGTGVDGSLQTFTLPSGVCSIRIEAAGARGGFGATNGAIMRGTFATDPGLVLELLVGQQSTNLAGGGGTFVVDADDNLWMAAGGGGSNNSAPANPAESHGRVETSGGTFGPTARADNGQGGRIVPGSNASGGGGFNQNGSGIAAGKAFLEGGRGGGPAPGESYLGGYGGGGARGGLWGEGGGGGYSGGSCGNTFSGGSGTWVGCGGGGSFNGGVEQNNTAGANSGPGYVLISW